MNGKRLLCAAIALILLIPLAVFSASAKTEKIKADGFNSVRGSGQLIIYTPDMGETTATNEWGAEAVIENDRCVKVGGNNNTIPKNGFVISGHDEGEGGKNMGKWIKDKVSVGDYVYYDAGGNITVSDEPQASPNYYEVEATVNGFNVTRGENFLVIYNQRGKKTGTNQWGYEVTVTSGFITDMGGNDNTVPSLDDSFVISGHGTMVEWLQENARLGMRAEYDIGAKKLKLIYDEAAAMAGVEALYGKLSSAYDEALENYINFDSKAVKNVLQDIQKQIQSAKNAYYKDKNGAALSAAAEKISASIEQVSLALTEKRAVEYRAVWLRPTQTSASEVDAYVQKLYDAGINAICIETIYDCTMIMPMPEDSLFEVNPKFKHFDLLKSYIDSCHKRGMELHCWFPIFYVGDAASANAKRSPASKRPEWRSISNVGTWNNPDNFMMLDPGSEEVQDFLLANYKYILETYDIDGFQLDYIRYYSRGTIDFGYNESSLEAFKEKYGVKPEFNMRASYWNDWVQFRCDYVTKFVSRMRKLIDEVAPDVLLSADVGADPTDAKQSIYQDYFTWLNNGWLDVLFPMAYGLGYEKAIASQTARCGDKAMIAVGLGIFMSELGPEVMFDQITYGRAIGTDGAAFFEASSYLKKNTGEYLKQSVYSEKALAPYFDKAASAKACAAQAADRINNVILPQKGINSADAKKIIDAINAFADSCTDKAADMELYKAAVEAIAASGASAKAKDAIKRDILIAAKIYNIGAKNFDLSDLPDTPVDVDPGDESSSAGVSDESSASVSENVSENTGSEVDGESADNSGSLPGTDGSEAEKPAESNGKTGLIVAIAAAATAIAAVAASLIYRKKKIKKIKK